MGYNTRFKGSVDGSGPFMEKFRADADNGDRFGDPANGWSFPLWDFFERWINDSEPMSWYEYPEHMTALSKEYPTLTFILEGEGEESGDVWREYYRDGKSVSVKAVLTYPEIDLDEELPVSPEAKKREEAVLKEVRSRLEREVAIAKRKLAELDA